MIANVSVVYLFHFISISTQTHNIKLCNVGKLFVVGLEQHGDEAALCKSPTTTHTFTLMNAVIGPL